jgi:hypothetical protein
VSLTLASHTSGRSAIPATPPRSHRLLHPAPAEAALGAVDQGLGLRRADPDRLADLAVRAPLELAEDQRASVRVREIRKDGQHEVALDEAVERLLGPGVEVLVLVLLDGAVVEHGPARPAPDHVERHVRRDARDPRLEREAAVEPVQALEDADHRLLEGLVGVVGVRQQPPADVSGQPAVTLVDLDECLGMSGLEVQNEHPIV